MRISDWSSDVCSSDLVEIGLPAVVEHQVAADFVLDAVERCALDGEPPMHGASMKLEFGGDSLVRAVAAGEQLHDQAARLRVQRRPLFGERGDRKSVV